MSSFGKKLSTASSSENSKNLLDCSFGFESQGKIWLQLGVRGGKHDSVLLCSSKKVKGVDLVCEPWEVSRHFRELKVIRVTLEQTQLKCESLVRCLDDWFSALEVGSCLEIIVNFSTHQALMNSQNIEQLMLKAGFARIKASLNSNGCTAIVATKITRKDERQVAPDLSGIRADHLARYELASGFLKSPMDVGDFACGIGYGTYILANSGPVRSVVGADIDAGAIEYAQQHYGTEKTTFLCADLLNLSLAPASLDIITSFETIEHIREPEPLLVKFNEFLKQGGLFLCSTPNEEVAPLASFGNPYHYCHYTPQEFEDMLKAAGFEVIGKYTQTERLSRDMNCGWHGIYNTAVCRKVAKPSGRRLSALRQRIEKNRSKNRKSGFQKLLSLAAIVLRPWQIVPALRHRVRHQASWRIRYHRVLAAACRLTGKKFIADMDWYGYANFSFSNAIAECGALKGKYVVRQLPRSFVFELNSPQGTVQHKALDAMNYMQLFVGGLNLWDICRTSIAKELGHLPGEDVNDKDLRAIGKYFHWARQCFAGVVSYLDNVKPDMVVVFQGGLFDSRIILECAKQRGLRVISLENCFLPDYAFVDGYSGFIINRHELAEREPVNYRSHLQLKSGSDIQTIWREQLERKSSEHRTGGVDISTLGLPSDKKIILLLGQVANDASIVMDSTIFKTTADFIVEVANIAGRHADWFLVVRLHPKEAWHVDSSGRDDFPGEYLWDNTLQSINASGVKLPDNCLVVSGPDVSTYQLMERSQVGVTINSQAGLEMLLLGKPVVTAGRCFYANKGFTHDVVQRDDLEAALLAAMAIGLSSSQKKELDLFLSYLLGHYLLPKAPRLAGQREKRLREILGEEDRA